MALIEEGIVTKGFIIGLVACGLLFAGCGTSKPPIDETGQTTPGSGAQGTTTTEPGDANRPDRAEVERMAEIIASLNTIYFDFDKYNLRDDARRILDRNAEILKTNPDVKIVIEGNCDERGTNEYNLALGDNRAKAARDYLIRLGIDASRITTISYGEERPVAMGHDEGAWSQNRRGDFKGR
jgi:peptidoglycan-associated lipoprotein